jgi:hypothetical protein
MSTLSRTITTTITTTTTTTNRALYCDSHDGILDFCDVFCNDQYEEERWYSETYSTQ